MRKITKNTGSAVMGIDLGRKRSQIAVVESGEVVDEFAVTMNRDAVRKAFEDRPRCEVVMEACGGSPWVSRLLDEMGFRSVVVASDSLKRAFHHRQKTDRSDARALAQLRASGLPLLRPVSHRPEVAQRDLAIFRIRDSFVHQRTQLINAVRGILASLGVSLPKCSTPSFAKRASDALNDEDRALVGPALRQITALSHEIRQLDAKIQKRAAESYPAVQLVTQVRGVGVLTGLAFVLTVTDPARFPKSRSIGAYLGLVSRLEQSGDSNPQLSITKAGDAFCRRLMVQAAHYILGPFGPDTDLRRIGLAIADRGGKNAKKRAAVAVARRLSVLLLSLWKTGEVYEPLRNTQQRAKAKSA